MTDDRDHTGRKPLIQSDHDRATRGRRDRARSPDPAEIDLNGETLDDAPDAEVKREITDVHEILHLIPPHLREGVKRLWSHVDHSERRTADTLMEVLAKAQGAPLHMERVEIHEALHGIEARVAGVERAAGDHSSQLVEIHGRDGKNGKLGRVAKVLDKVMAAAIASVATAVVAIYLAGEARGDERARLRAAETTILELEAEAASQRAAFETLRVEFWHARLSLPVVPALPAAPDSGGPP